MDQSLLHALFLLAALPLLRAPGALAAPGVCVVGSGIGGASVAYFLKQYTCAEKGGLCVNDIRIFERRGRVGGRMATVTIGGDTFEAGASIIHPKNLHALRFASLLGLKRKTKASEVDPNSNASSSSSSSSGFGVWDGERFVFKTLPPPPSSSSAIYRMIRELLNSLLLFRRYGFSLLRMERFVKTMVERFLLYYKGFESRPVFETVEEMLKWSNLYGLTRRTLQEELADARLSPLLISELVTVITRINYGQNVSISGLAGAVSLAGSDSGLWSVDGGNWQLAAGLVKHTNATLYLHEEIDSISYSGSYYVLNSIKGNSYNCEVTVIATPLDELNITFEPPVSVPNRRLQHTFTTFVRGLLNPNYFGLNSASEIPNLVGTVELPDIPFSSISVLKKYSEEDMTYKVFSRAPLEDDLLNRIFSTRKEVVRINWPAYPHYEAPEVFAPILLDGIHLYYINSFESAASSIETSSVAAENVARLIISRFSGLSSNAPSISSISAQDNLHFDL
ncbi:farnesylcysteine lyase [Phoenix dactylifera]|uniref:Farnesylcysteine lyase n=1 Tax=Phoenix dactylifera TaxID=42345 RepID=A0A8B7BQN5_PHODC|nr:farnesylcysteine lyase [Phoenix dactylifera]